MKFNELIEHVQQWSIDKGLDQQNGEKQFVKIFEEAGELAAGICKDNLELVKDSIGDVYVTLIIYAQQLDLNFVSFETDVRPLSATRPFERLVHLIADNNPTTATSELFDATLALSSIANYYDLTPTECLQCAWNEIKNRTGKMINGSFVKSADLEKGEHGVPQM